MYELEGNYHDKSDMCSVTVMDHEIEYLKNKCKKLKGGDLEFFQSEIENLEFNKTSLVTSIQNEFITLSKYITDMKKYTKNVDKLRAEATTKLGPKHETTLRLVKRLELLKSEIKEMEDGMQQQEQQAEVAPVETKQVIVEVATVGSAVQQ